MAQRLSLHAKEARTIAPGTAVERPSGPGYLQDRWYQRGWAAPVAWQDPYFRMAFPQDPQMTHLGMAGCPCSAQIVTRNPLSRRYRFLGEILPDAATLMDTDPGVSSLRGQLQVLEAQYNAIPSPLHGSYSYRRPHARTSTRVRWSYEKKDACKHAFYAKGERVYSGFVSRPVTNSTTPRTSNNPTQSQHLQLMRQACLLKRNMDNVRARLKEAENRVWDRVSVTVPYKGFVIKPIIDRSKNEIRYALTKDGTAIGAPYQRLDEAKAIVDEEIRLAQEKEFAEISKQRAEAEKKQFEQEQAAAVKLKAQQEWLAQQSNNNGGAGPSAPIQHQSNGVPQMQTMVGPGNSQTTVPGTQAPASGGMGKVLLIGGAAAAALLLMK